MKVVDNPEVKKLVRECVQQVTGARLAVRYQLGRGVIQPAQADPDASAGSAAGVPGDTAPGAPVSAAPVASPGAERMLIDGLGAEVIGEN
jgi:hypothetical protein